jgi:hypothetical protein
MEPIPPFECDVIQRLDRIEAKIEYLLAVAESDGDGPVKVPVGVAERAGIIPKQPAMSKAAAMHAAHQG